MSLGGEVIKTVGIRALLAIFGFAGTVLFARILGPVAFGGFYLLYTIVQLVDRPFRGWTAAIEKRYSEYDSNRDRILGAAVAFNVLGLSVITPFALFLDGRLSLFTGLEESGILFILLLSALVFFYPFEQLITAEGRAALASAVDGVRSVLTLGIQLVLVLAGFGAAGMAFGLTGATVITVGINFYLLGRIPSIPDLPTMRSIVEFAKYAIPTSIIGKTYGRLDTLLLGLVLTPTAVGEYEVAMKLTVPAIFVSNSIQQALFPRVSNLHSRGEEIGSDIANSKAFTSILAIPMFFGSVALSKRLIVTVYGSDYAGAAVLLVGLTLYRIINTQNQIHVRTLEAIDRPRSVFRASAVALAVNIPLGYVLLLNQGAVGVVIATIVAEIIRYALVVSMTRSSVPNIGIIPSEFIRQVGASVVMFFVILWVRGFVEDWSWFVVLAIVFTGGVVYFAVLTLLSRKLRVTTKGILADLRAEA